MTARIEVWGRLGDAPSTEIIGGERFAGAPVVSRLPGRDGAGAGDWCLFVIATGAPAKVLVGCVEGDTVHVVGEVRAARSITGTNNAPGSRLVVVDCQAETVERREPRH